MRTNLWKIAFGDCELSNVMLLLPSRKSSLKDPNMVLSHLHSFMTHSDCEQEREDNNNTIDEKDVLRTAPANCRFRQIAHSYRKQIGGIIDEPRGAC